MSNEVEIVITSKNKARPAVDSARRDFTGLGGTVAKVADSMRASMAHAAGSITTSFRRAISETKRDAARGGRDIGSRLVASAVGAVRGAAGRVSETFSSVFQGGLKSALSTPAVGAIVAAAVAAVATSASGALATLISGALVLGVGGAVVGVGAALLAQDEKIKKRWTSTWKDLKQVMTDAAAPLRPVLETTRKTLSSVVKDLAPEIEKGFKTAQGPMQRFVKSLGEGFKNLAPSIEPLFTAFGGILDDIGPRLPRIFQGISNAVTEVATTINENRDLFGALFEGLITAATGAIRVMSTLVSVWRGSLSIMAGGLGVVAGAIASVLEAVAEIPGPWQESMRAAANSVRGAQEKLAGFRHDLENFPRRVELEGDIADLEGKIATAKAKLKDPKLTRPEKAKIQAEIAQLQAQVDRAKAELATIRNRTVRITAVRVGDFSTPRNPGLSSEFHGVATGGIIGAQRGLKRFATGGISGAGSSTALVGEDGPEIVRLPVGSSVTPAGQTRSMLGRAGNSISMAFRAAGGGGGDSSSALQSMIEKLTAMLKEVVTLRDAFGKLSGGIFGSHRALIAYEEAWDAARKSLKENGRVLSIGREKGRENRSALLSLAEAAQEVAVAMREQGRSTTSITAKMKEQRSEFIRIARSMGFTSKAARELADKYGLIPKKVKTAIEAEIKTTKSNKAINKKISALERASGGPAGGMTLLGERGPELVNLPFGSQVTPAGQSAAMMSRPTATRPVVLEIRSGGSKMDDLLVEILRSAVRSRGGDVQVVLGQRSR